MVDVLAWFSMLITAMTVLINSFLMVSSNSSEQRAQSFVALLMYGPVAYFVYLTLTGTL